MTIVDSCDLELLEECQLTLVLSIKWRKRSNTKLSVMNHRGYVIKAHRLLKPKADAVVRRTEIRFYIMPEELPIQSAKFHNFFFLLINTF